MNWASPSLPSVRVQVNTWFGNCIFLLQLCNYSFWSKITSFQRKSKTPCCVADPPSLWKCIHTWPLAWNHIYCVNSRRQYFACALDWVIVKNATKHIDVSVIWPALVKYYASKNVAESQVGNVNVSLPTNITIQEVQAAIVLGSARVNSKPTSL